MPLRRLIQNQVHGLVGFGSGVDLDRGDVGLFGPGSVAWRVHGDFTSMMVGGIGALMLQMLHPGALAGVWDHSNFRADMAGRLRRTAQFISGTTYGSTQEAERLIARVRSVHDRVQGQLPDGTPYSANDPALLTWVHVAEMSSFLAAYLRFRDPALPGEAQDRYYAETAVIAERLGATDVPRSRREVEAFFGQVRPRLLADERTREVLEVLRRQPTPDFVSATVRDLMMAAAADLLPSWAARMHGLGEGPLQRGIARTGVRGVGTLVRWALRDSSARRARARAEALAAANA